MPNNMYLNRGSILYSPAEGLRPYDENIASRCIQALERELRQLPSYLPMEFMQIRHQLYENLKAYFSFQPDDFIEGNLGETSESFKRLDEML